MPLPVPLIPPRRSLAFFAALAMAMVCFSYLFILLLAAACVYLPFLIIARVTNFQTLALLVAGGTVAGSMLWSLVPRRDKFASPGMALERATHPRLFAELDHIAGTLQESLPCEVYLIPQANAWVADRGGFMGFGSRRVMGLGLPLLAALNVSQFRAILAHEFAHYYGGDTKLGPLLHRTQMAMIRTFENMGSVGRAMRVALMQVLYVIVFGILKWYWKIFLRAINIVSRRQEFRADELACIVAGPEPLMSGLRILHGASMAWPSFLKTELSPMIDMGCLASITDGFAMFLGAPAISKQVEIGIDNELRNGKTEPYDSHPPLRDRIDAAKKLTISALPEDTQPASCLLDDLSNEELRFLGSIIPDLAQKSLRRVAWEDQGIAVLVPSWSEFVSRYSPLLEGMHVGNLVESLGKVPQFAPSIQDPTGMLLTAEQRVERGRALLSTALALSLARTGWHVHATPGEFSLSKGQEKLDPFKIVLQLSDGAISNDDWVAKCRALDIENTPLWLTSAEAAHVEQETLPLS